jgi:hypothetical protein
MNTTCPESELLPEYLTQRLSHADAARLEDHLAGCATCQRLADELEIGLAAMAIARDEVEREQAAAGSRPDAGPAQPPAASAARRRRSRWIPIVAAACAALVIGTGVGIAFERLTAGPETVAEFTLASASDTDAASGTATLAVVSGGLQVGLDLAGLPTDAEFFECLWHTDGGTRSAGTFGATDGLAKVNLVVAPFAGPPKWTLDIVAHIPGEEPRVVLTAST